MEPRTGKTKVVIDWLSILFLRDKVGRVVIICPVSVIGIWQEEIEKHCPVDHRITVWDKDGRKQATLPLYGRTVLDIVLLNYEAFSTPGQPTRRAPDKVDEHGRVVKRGEITRRSTVRGGRYDAKRAIIRWNPDCIVLDESHRIKSPRAKKSTMIHSLGSYVKYRVIMTGTAVTKKKRVYDLYSQWLFLNPESPLLIDPRTDERHTLSTFRSLYGRWTNRRGYPQWLRPKNEVLLRKLLHAEAFAVTRDECFDLPPARRQIVPVEITGHTAEVYDQMAENLVARIKTGEITQASIKLVQGPRLSQITSGIAKTEPTDERPEGRWVRLGRDKLNVLKELLSDLFEADEHVVVAARWRADITAIVKLGKELGSPVYELHGGIDRRERDRMRHEFNAADGPALFVMQPSAGGMGIDLSSAATFIWFSFTQSWVDYRQAEDRIALAPRGTVYMYLIARGTIDQEHYDVLQEDGDLAARITESPDKLLRTYKKLWHPKNT